MKSRLWLLLCLSIAAADVRAQAEIETLKAELKPLLADATARQQEVTALLGQMAGLMDVDGLATLGSERLGQIAAYCPRARAALAQAEIALVALDRGTEALIAKSSAAAQAGFATTAELRQTTVEFRHLRASLVDESCQLVELLLGGGWELQPDGSLGFDSDVTAGQWNQFYAQRNVTAEKYNAAAARVQELRAAGTNKGE